MPRSCIWTESTPQVRHCCRECLISLLAPFPAPIPTWPQASSSSCPPPPLCLSRQAYCFSLRSSLIMPKSTCCEMAQSRCRNNTMRAQYQTLCSTDDLIATLIAATSHRYTPAASSPLNPRSSSDSKPRKHAAARPKRPRPARKASSETPTERLLRRKAAIAYERTTKSSPTPRKDGSAVILTRLCEPPKKGPSATFAAREAPPTKPKETGPLVVSMWEVRHDLLTDVERQSAIRLSEPRHLAASRERLELPLMLVLLSACLTLLTVLGLDSLKGHYVAG